MVVALIMAGGIGSRLGADRPKQFVEILGKPVLAYTIENYQNHPEIDAIEVACHPDWIDYLKETIKKYNLSKVKWIAEGGDTFQKTAINGINNLKDKISNDDIVMIQYGAAPYTSKKIISEGLKVCREKGSSFSCTPSFQLMGTFDNNGNSSTAVNRLTIAQIACPQSYKFDNLLDIYRQGKEQNLLDVVDPHTTSLMYALGMTLNPSYGNQTNIKITTEEDLDLFEAYALVRQQKKLRGTLAMD